MHFRRPFLRGSTLQGETRPPTMLDPTALLAAPMACSFLLTPSRIGTASDRLKTLVGLYDWVAKTGRRLRHASTR